MATVHATGLFTNAIHGGRTPDPATGAILTPIYQTTTFVQEAVGEHKGFTYSRAANPTVAALESALASLEDAPHAACFASGMAAITALFFSVLRSGDHAVVSDVVYGGTVRLAREVLEGLGVEVTFADLTTRAGIIAALRPRTRLVFVESPGNPTLKLVDIEAVARAAHAVGALLAVDNTLLTPVLQRPLDLGADVSVTSTTKYIEGHNATIGGALVTRVPALDERFRLIRKTIGANQSPFDAWLTLRGITTLPLRMHRHADNAQAVAEWLVRHPAVIGVRYPGLEGFPQYELARRQQRAPGALIAFELRGGVPAAHRFLRAIERIALAENLGAAESLATHPATMTHADVDPAERARLGITDGLIRLSVGLEDVSDIVADLEQALAVATAAKPVATASEPVAPTRDGREVR